MSAVPHPLRGHAKRTAPRYHHPCPLVVVAWRQFDVLKTRLMNQTDSMVEPEMRYKGFVDAYFRILREEGVTALHKGIVPRLVRLAPGQGLTWIMVEKVNTIYNENGWLQ